MKDIEIKINIRHCQLDELDAADRELVECAIEATENAYAEYSHFFVGAAARLADGTIVKGANQENAAFPSGLCAERTAIFAAQANYPDQPVTCIAIAARNDCGLLSEPVSPCGACRQVMTGIESRYGKDMRVLLYGQNGVYCVATAKDLMPLSFVDDSMK